MYGTGRMYVYYSQGLELGQVIKVTRVDVEQRIMGYVPVTISKEVICLTGGWTGRQVF